MNTAIKKKKKDEEFTRKKLSPTYFVLLNYISVCFSVCVCDLRNAFPTFSLTKKRLGWKSLGKICLCVFAGVFAAFVDPWHDKQDLVDWLSSLALDAGSDHSSYL